MAIQFTGGTVIFKSVVNALYDFTSFTFTNAGVSGSLGPGIDRLRAAYTGSSSGSVFSNSNYFTTGAFNGYQMWTVPQTGNYQITAAGSRSGMGTGVYAAPTSAYTGSGAIIQATLPLVQGQKLIMVVGSFSDATGSSQSSYTTYLGFGGGGGSFVVLSGSALTPLVVAGGGGGAGHYSSYNAGAYYYGKNGVTTTSGSASQQGALGATGSLGGMSHRNSASLASTNTYDAGGGAGFLGNGYNGDGTITKPYTAAAYGGGGYSFVSGSIGGVTGTSYIIYAGSPGGFGGAGGGNGIITGGGGGGYAGGGGSYSAIGPASDAGGGGGSYIYTTATNVATSDGRYNGLTAFSGSSITNLNLYNNKAGYITITKL
jgi:hypothetical protein